MASRAWHSDGSFDDDPRLFDLIACVVRVFGEAVVRMGPGSDVESRRTGYYALMSSRGITVETTYDYGRKSLVISECLPRIHRLIDRHHDEVEMYRADIIRGGVAAPLARASKTT